MNTTDDIQVVTFLVGPQEFAFDILQIERILPGIEGLAFVYLDEEDVVRHRMVREIIRAYAEDQTG